ncbi:transglycosylase SLT domain-containing protein [Rhodobacteraceae bacterium N5(2021)]|uniref:Transglycosylase SLT domain-containing protein n=2 Tax=Gymnodinialimonas phycosphaerae TaxID=2841589 RepID=A0A975YHU1_9RHOB|nr:transglycosylase SLT domain-containing protein [Gymnodinialimonas phycosphaerae]
MAAFAPGISYGQDAGDVAGDVDVTSGVVGADAALDGDPPGVAALLNIPVEEDILPEDLIPLEGVLDDVPEISALAPASSPRPVVRDSWAVPVARWDNHPRGAQWTAAVLSALRGPGAPLLETEPNDIRAWCPGYLEATPAQRAAFWTGLVSTLAWHESSHDPRAVGGGGQWFGLVQIAPGTARWRDCDVGSGEALLNGTANLRCGIRIMGITVPRDNVISDGMRGVAADWGPFHSSRKREDMRNWVRQQEYCQAPAPRMRPVMRPVGLAEGAMTSDAAASDVLPAAMARPTLRPVPRPQRL